MQKAMIALGIALVVIGLLWPLIMKLGLGRLPGDISIERDGFRFWFPLTTSLLVSIVLSLVIALWLWFRGR